MSGISKSFKFPAVIKNEKQLVMGGPPYVLTRFPSIL